MLAQEFINSHRSKYQECIAAAYKIEVVQTCTCKTANTVFTKDKYTDTVIPKYLTGMLPCFRINTYYIATRLK